MPIILVTHALFPLGHVVITPNAKTTLSSPTILDALQRHATGDWGSLTADDMELNDEALRDGDRIHSAYGEGPQRFWIITESDRSATTILMPEDY